MPRLIDHAERRAELAEAVWRVVLREGVAHVSVRTVAAEAGVSTGSLRHILPTYDELVAAALELVNERVTARVMGLSESLVGKERALAIVAELLPLDAPRRAELEVQLSLIALSFSNRRLAQLRDESDAALLRACHHVLGLIGAADSDLEAARLYALVDGLALHLIYRTSLTPAAAMEAVALHLDTLGEQ